MLEIIMGRAGSGKTRYCLQEIKKKLLQDPLGKAIILLVPEHMTYKVERELASLMSQEGKGVSRCYVYGFKRFAYQVLQETGGGLLQGITKLGRHLLLRQILDKRVPELTAFQRAASKKGFTSELGEIITEFKSYQLTDQQLGQLSQVVEDTHLKGKLADLSLLYGDYNAAMSQRYEDSKDILQKAVEKIPQSTWVAGADIWLDGFTFFNPLEYQILTALLQYSQDMHFTLAMPTSNIILGKESHNISRENLFYRSLLTRNTLLKMAQGAEKQVVEQDVTILANSNKKGQSVSRYQNVALAHLESQWGKFKREPLATTDSYGDNVQIVEAANIRLELEAMATDLLHLVRDKNYSWNDIGILIRDEDSYGDQTQMILQKFGIPYFSDAKRLCIHHPLAELLRSALIICTHRYGWNYENVFRCLKTGFFGITLEQLDLLENYVLEYGIRGKKNWAQTEDWQYQVGFSATTGANSKQSMRAIQADQLRRKVARPLLKLQEELQQAESMKGRTIALYNFLMELQVTNTLQEWMNRENQAGNLEKIKEHQQIWGDVMNLFDQMVEIAGTTEATTKTEALLIFSQILEEGLNELSMSLIPPGLDYVNIASFDQNSLDNTRAMYILGANVGVMPGHTGENIILSDADRVDINKYGKLSAEAEQCLTVIGEENSYKENYLLYRGFTQAREYLWVSYALSDNQGKPREKSQIIKQIQESLPQVALHEVLQPEDQRHEDSTDWEHLVASPRQAVSALAVALRNCQEQGYLAKVWQATYNWFLQESEDRPDSEALKLSSSLIKQGLFARYGEDKLPPELAEKLYTRNKTLRGSVTKLEGYNKCPFQFYAKYGLNLKERRISDFSNPELGTLLHGIFKEFGETLKKENRHWCDVSPVEQQTMCHDILEKLAQEQIYPGLLLQNQIKAQLRRIEKTAVFSLNRLCEFDKVSQMNPTLFEESFGGAAIDSNQKTLELVYSLNNGHLLELNGQIDRIDCSSDGKYFMVIDYKTGTAAINIMDVYYGIKLQLLMYLLVTSQLLALKQGQKTLSIGMLYCFLKQPRVNVNNHHNSVEEAKKKLEAQLRMPGWIVAEKPLVDLIDNSLKPGDSSQFINVKLTNKGALSGTQNTLRTERELELLLAYVEKNVQETGNCILAGEIQPEPYRTKEKNVPCTYCQYNPLCGFDTSLSGFNYKKISLQDNEIMDNIQEQLTREDVARIENRLEERLAARQEEVND